MALLTPEKYFSRLSSINIERDLLASGLSNVLLDIDNTLVARGTHSVARDAGIWLGRARDAGIRFCLLSNNWHQSAKELAESLQLPIVAKACKPLPHGYIMAMKKLGSNRKNTVAVGDQLVTDVIGAHAVGMSAFLIQPLVEEDLKHTLVLRNLERALMAGRQPEPAPAKCDMVEDVCAAFTSRGIYGISNSHGKTIYERKGQ